MITNNDLEQAAQFINFLKVVSSGDDFKKLVEEYQATIIQLNSKLGLLQSKEAFDLYVQKNKAILTDERTQLEKDKALHAEEVNKFQEEKRRMLDEASSIMAEAQKKQLEATNTLNEAEKIKEIVAEHAAEVAGKDAALSVREASLEDREAALNNKAAKMKELFQ